MNTIHIPIFFDSIIEEIPEEIARLAFELHSQRTQSITIEVSDQISFFPGQIDDLLYIKDTELIFTSIAARNHCAAVHCFRKFENSDLPLDAHKIYDEAHQLEIDEIGHTDFASGRFLGLMSQKLNVLRAGIETINNSNSHYVFNVLRNIGNALPFLGVVNMQDLVDLAEAQRPKTSRDLAAGMFFNQLSEYLAIYPMLAKELYTLVREEMTIANTGLYGTTLIGMAKAEQVREATELALDDADSERCDLLAGALWTLGRLSHYWEKESDLKDRVQKVLKVMGHHLDSNVSFQAWQAMSNAAVSQSELVSELLIHAQRNHQKALQVLGDFAFMNFKIVKDHPNLTEILHALTSLDAERTNDFDHVLSQLIKINIHDELVYDSLTTWVVKHYDSRTSDEKLGSCFAQSIRELIDKPLLHKLITRWLISDERILGRSLS